MKRYTLLATFMVICACSKPTPRPTEPLVEPTTPAKEPVHDPNRYQSSLEDPDNILTAATDLQVPPEARDGGTLRLYLGSDIRGWNWLLENSVDVANLQALVHNTFARRDFNDPDRWVPELAHKITVNEDFTRYVVHLREDVYWHRPVTPGVTTPDWLKERRKLTAEDCVFFFELMQNPDVSAGALKAYYDELEGASVIDEHTFEVRWKRTLYHSRTFTIGLYPMSQDWCANGRDALELAEHATGDGQPRL